MTASLARPFSGGAITLIFKASPSQPTILSRDDPGTTLTLRRTNGSGAFVTVPAIPYVFAFEGDSKSDSKSDSLSARRRSQGTAPTKRHTHQKSRPQNDLRHPAA